MADLLSFNPNRALTANIMAAAGARAFFYDAGTTNPKTVYADVGLTTPHPSPLLANSAGVFAAVYTDGLPTKVVVQSSSGATLYTIDLAEAVDAGVTEFATVAALLADTRLTYSTGAYVVGAGTILSTREEGFRYKVAASGATDHHVTTAGGVKLYVLAGHDGSVSVKAFGAVGDGVADDTAAIQAALDAADRIYIPEGTYAITNQAAAGLTVSVANKNIVGAGMDVATLVYTSDTADRPAILVTADNVHISHIGIDGTANATKASEPVPNCIGIRFQEVSECSARECRVEGGHYGIAFISDTGAYGDNQYNVASGNVLRNLFSTGVYMRRAEYALVEGNDAADCGNDGFKTAVGTRRVRILGNTSRNNGRDGFDLFDGFIESVLDGNVAEGNALQGYEVKGTFDGTYSAGDYVVRDSTFSNNIATANGTGGTVSGFVFQSIRNCSIVGNVSISNTGSGFYFNTIQGCTVSGCTATKNIQHGFDLAVSVSRLQVSGCYAADNSWVDGTTQNGTYHGFNIGSGCAAQFGDCSSINSPTTGIRGGQGYGWNWAAVQAGSRLVNCYTLGNVTGGFGGPAGWAANNGIFNATNNGIFKGIQYTDDTLLALSIVGTVSPSVDNLYDLGLTGTRWRRGFFRNGIEVTTPNGLAKYVISVDNAGNVTSTLVP